MKFFSSFSHVIFLHFLSIYSVEFDVFMQEFNQVLCTRESKSEWGISVFGYPCHSTQLLFYLQHECRTFSFFRVVW